MVKKWHNFELMGRSSLVSATFKTIGISMGEVGSIHSSFLHHPLFQEKLEDYEKSLADEKNKRLQERKERRREERRQKYIAEKEEAEQKARDEALKKGIKSCFVREHDFVQ